MARLYGPRPEPAEPLRPVGDLAGLPVDDADGRPAGAVHGSLAESRSGLVRYLDVALLDSDRHVLVPIGHARVEHRDAGDRARVRLRAATRDELRTIPPYRADRERLDDRYQRAVLSRHGRIFQGERYYAHPAYDHDGLFAGEHPIVRDAAPADPLPAGVLPLSDLPAFRVAGHEPDIRGWPVVSGAHETVGRVEDLVVDPEAHRVRYAIVAPGDGADRPRLLPVGFLRVVPAERRVELPVLTRADLLALPAYNPDRPLTRADEDRLRHSLTARLDGERRYDRPDFRLPGARA